MYIGVRTEERDLSRPLWVELPWLRGRDREMTDSPATSHSLSSSSPFTDYPDVCHNQVTVSFDLLRCHTGKQ